MPIQTDVTDVSSFEVIDPIDVAPPGSEIGAYVEEGTQQLVLNEQVVDVPFLTNKASLSYLWDELVISNTVDATPLVLESMVTDKQLTGFQLTLSAKPDTGNYYLKWKVRIPTSLVNGVTISATTGGTSGGTVKQVSVATNDGLTQSVVSASTFPSITLGIADAGIPLSKLAETPVTGEVLTPTNVKTVVNKSIDGNSNTLTHIPYGALTGPGVIIGTLADPGTDQGLIWDAGLGSFRFVGTPTARGIGKDVFISVRTDSKNGTGTLDDPFNAGGVDDAAKSTALVAIMADSAKCPTNANIYFSAGTFFPYRIVCRDGWKLHLTPQTTFQLRVLSGADALALGAPKVLGMFESPNTFNQDLSFDSGIWDLNMQNQTQAICPSAVQTVCDGFKFTNAKVINFANTSPTNAECFVVGNFTNGSRDSRIHSKGNLFENNEFAALASGVVNTGSVTIINACGGQNVSSNSVLSNGWFDGVTVRNNRFHDISGTDSITLSCINLGGWAKAVQVYGNKFRNVYRSGGSGFVAVGVYCDTGSLIDVTIANNQYSKVFSPIQTLSSVGWVRTGIKVFNEVATAIDYIGIRFSETNGTATDYTIDNCNFAGTTSADGGFEVYDVTGLKTRNNVFTKTSNQIYIGASATTIVHRINNVTATGTPVTGETAPVLDAAVLHTTGNESKAGTLTLTTSPVQLGNKTGASTATPFNINLGGTFSSGAGQNPKVIVFDNNTDQYGIGVSSNQLDYIAPTAGGHAFYSGGTRTLLLNTALLTLSEGVNINTGTTTGSILAATTVQKLGVYGATPIVQRTGAAQAAVVTTAATQSTPYGYATQAQADALVTLVNELRAWAVAQGFIKGSA